MLNELYRSLWLVNKKYIYIHWLVVSTPLKNMKVSWDDEIPNIWTKIKTYSKPPTSYIYKCWIYGAFQSHGATPSHHIIHFRLGFP
jgi:hypothetical protein